MNLQRRIEIERMITEDGSIELTYVDFETGIDESQTITTDNYEEAISDIEFLMQLGDVYL